MYKVASVYFELALLAGDVTGYKVQRYGENIKVKKLSVERTPIDTSVTHVPKLGIKTRNFFLKDGLQTGVNGQETEKWRNSLDKM